MPRDEHLQEACKLLLDAVMSAWARNQTGTELLMLAAGRHMKAAASLSVLSGSDEGAGHG